MHYVLNKSSISPPPQLVKEFPQVVYGSVSDSVSVHGTQHQPQPRDCLAFSGGMNVPGRTDSSP